METAPTKIVQLKATNIKRLSAIQINADGNMIIVGGENGAGKTSALDSIMYALAGTRSIPEKVVREGSKTGEIELKLDNGYKVIRKFSNGRSTLRVMRDGNVQSSPQDVVSKWCSGIAFDPLEFSRMSCHAQLATLSKLVGLEFSDHDSERESVYRNRTDVNREIKRIEGALANFPVIAPGDDSDANDSVDDATAALSSAKDMLSHAESCKRSIASHDATLDRLRGELERINNEIAAAQASKKQQEKELASIGEIPDIAALEEKVSRIAAARENAAIAKQRNELQSQLAEAKKESGKLTANLEAMDKSKRDAITNAEYPIDGLALTETCVEFNGIPFDQLSSSEQLNISVAVGIAMNPTLKVLLVRDGSLLDANSLKQMSDAASRSGAQVWIERVGDGDEGAIIIEDGHVRGDD